jgi:flagellar biosynthesis protein
MDEKRSPLGPEAGQSPTGQSPAPRARAIAVQSSGGAAVIAAKGEGFEAERILDLAFAHGVPVRQDASLTDMLTAFDVDSAIPEPALEAVAVVLAHVYEATRGERGQPKGAEGAA